MATSELILQDFDVEISNTRRTLQRVPEGQNDWAPHEKSMRLGKLAMHCATLPYFGLFILEDDGMDLANPTRPQSSLNFISREAALQQFEEGVTAARCALAKSSDARLGAPWPFTYGQMVISSGPRSLAFRQMFFNHMVHHVAQLGVYLRLNNIPVPALYGPSADEQWSPPK